MICDVCGLPDLYRGQGDGIGSCDCPRCDHGCGVPANSTFCTGDPDRWDDDYRPWPAKLEG
ncbi:hypothetical protein ACIA59_10535 [Micromonospora haikouensis]|uniref:hypothetical protein n=1 Tax=Micromonospora haikouensis TaxID=686309 RepID=UPI0037A65181